MYNISTSTEVCIYHLLGAAVDADDLVVAVDEQDVLGLEVGVRELVVVQEQHAVDQLVRDVPRLLQGVRLVVVVFLQCHQLCVFIRYCDLNTRKFERHYARTKIGKTVRSTANIWADERLIN